MLSGRLYHTTKDGSFGSQFVLTRTPKRAEERDAPEVQQKKACVFCFLK